MERGSTRLRAARACARARWQARRRWLRERAMEGGLPAFNELVEGEGVGDGIGKRGVVKVEGRWGLWH